MRSPTLPQWNRSCGRRALTTLAGAETFRCTDQSMANGARLYLEAASIFRSHGETRWLSECLARRGYTSLYLAGHAHEGAEELSSALALLPKGDSTRAFWLTFYADVLDMLGRDAEADAAVTEALEDRIPQA